MILFEAMDTSQYRYWVTLMALWLTPASEIVFAGERTWTNLEGKEIVAELLLIREGSVQVRVTSSGKVYTLSIDSLSEADRQFIKVERGRREETKKRSALAERRVRWQEVWEKAQEEAEQLGLSTLLYYSSDQDGTFEDSVIDSDEFTEFARTNLVLMRVEVTADRQRASIRKQNEELRSRFPVSTFPTVYILNTNGEVLGGTVGYGGQSAREVTALYDRAIRANEVQPRSKLAVARPEGVLPAFAVVSPGSATNVIFGNIFPADGKQGIVESLTTPKHIAQLKRSTAEWRNSHPHVRPGPIGIVKEHQQRELGPEYEKRDRSGFWAGRLKEYPGGRIKPLSWHFGTLDIPEEELSLRGAIVVPSSAGPKIKIITPSGQEKEVDTLPAPDQLRFAILGSIPEIEKGTYQVMQNEVREVEVPPMLGLDCDRLFCEYLDPHIAHGNFRIASSSKDNSLEVRLVRTFVSRGRKKREGIGWSWRIPDGLAPLGGLIITPRGRLAEQDCLLYLEETESAAYNGRNPVGERVVSRLDQMGESAFSSLHVWSVPIPDPDSAFQGFDLHPMKTPYDYEPSNAPFVKILDSLEEASSEWIPFGLQSLSRTAQAGKLDGTERVAHDSGIQFGYAFPIKAGHSIVVRDKEFGHISRIAVGGRFEMMGARSSVHEEHPSKILGINHVGF